MANETRYAQLSEAAAAANRQETTANSQLLKVLMDQMGKLTNSVAAISNSVAALSQDSNKNDGG
jgi:hypothetical protein